MIDSSANSKGFVLIDDAGTPSESPGPRFLHRNRKSWAAVIVPPGDDEKLRRVLMIFLRGVYGEYGVKELHFPEIYGGRGAYEGVPLEKRYEIFRLMGNIFQAFELPIFFQTMSPEFLGELQRRGFPTGKRGWFSMNNHEHVGLLLLLSNVRHFLMKQKEVVPHPVPVLVDEGLVKAGTAIPVQGWADVFSGGVLSFHRSHQQPFLQLADFAAFATSRTQWIMASKSRKPRDKWFLEAVDGKRFWHVNLAKMSVDLEKFTSADYEELLAEDRLMKGLSADVEPDRL